MCLRWHWTWCTHIIRWPSSGPELIESNKLSNPWIGFLPNPCKYIYNFHLIAEFHCSFAVVPGISHLAYTHVWSTFLQEVWIYDDERVHQKKEKEMWRKDSWKFDDWKNDSSCQGFYWKTTGVGPATCGVRELLVLTSSIPQKDTDSYPLISGGVSKAFCS